MRGVPAATPAEAELLGTIKKHLDSGVSPKPSVFRQAHQGIYKKALKIFGNWPSVLQALGIDYRAVTGRFPRGALQDPAYRRRVLQEFVDSLTSPPTADDFKAAGLQGLLQGYYDNSLRKALADADRAHILTDQAIQAPPRVQDGLGMILSLPRLLDKAPSQLSCADIEDHLPGLLNSFGRSPFQVLQAAKLVEHPYDMQRVPNDCWKNIDNVSAAIAKAVADSDKPAREFGKADFSKHGLGGLLAGHFNNSSSTALVSAGLIPWRGAHKYPGKGFWEPKKNRIRATFEVLESSKKERRPQDLLIRDYAKHGRRGAIQWHQKKRKGDAIWRALSEAGIETTLEQCSHTPFSGPGRVHIPPCGCRVPSQFEAEVHGAIWDLGFPHDSSRAYPGEIRLTCDIVIPEIPALGAEVWIEAAGMIGLGGKGEEDYVGRLERKAEIARDQGALFLVVYPDDLLSENRLLKKLSPLASIGPLSDAQKLALTERVKTWQRLFRRRRVGYWTPSRVLERLRARRTLGKAVNSRAVELDEAVLYQYCRKFFGRYGCAFERAFPDELYESVAKRKRNWPPASKATPPPGSGIEGSST